jgi:hypothetical protein
LNAAIASHRDFFTADGAIRRPQLWQIALEAFGEGAHVEPRRQCMELDVAQFIARHVN